MGTFVWCKSTKRQVTHLSQVSKHPPQSAKCQSPASSKCKKHLPQPSVNFTLLTLFDPNFSRARACTASCKAARRALKVSYRAWKWPTEISFPWAQNFARYAPWSPTFGSHVHPGAVVVAAHHLHPDNVASFPFRNGVKEPFLFSCLCLNIHLAK